MCFLPLPLTTFQILRPWSRHRSWMMTKDQKAKEKVKVRGRWEIMWTTVWTVWTMVPITHCVLSKLMMWGLIVAQRRNTANKSQRRNITNKRKQNVLKNWLRHLEHYHLNEACFSFHQKTSLGEPATRSATTHTLVIYHKNVLLTFKLNVTIIWRKPDSGLHPHLVRDARHGRSNPSKVSSEQSE